MREEVAQKAPKELLTMLIDERIAAQRKSKGRGTTKNSQSPKIANIAELYDKTGREAVSIDDVVLAESSMPKNGSAPAKGGGKSASAKSQHNAKGRCGTFIKGRCRSKGRGRGRGRGATPARRGQPTRAAKAEEKARAKGKARASARSRGTENPPA